MSTSQKATFGPSLLRAAAMVTALGTVAFLFIGDDWRLSNLFLFPDLLVSAILITGAAAPPREMPLLLLTGFAIGLGVFSAAVADYAIRGQFGIGALTAFVTCLTASLWLLRSLLSARSGAG